MKKRKIRGCRVEYLSKLQNRVLETRHRIDSRNNHAVSGDTITSAVIRPPMQ